MICKVEIFFLVAFFSLHFDVCSSQCSRAEYEINGECCPMCAPGSCVYRHCTVDTSTICGPCPESTYTAVPNDLIICFSCTICDSGQGLRVKTPCTSSSDTVCEPLDGYYCTDTDRSSCRQAAEHTNCSPGQYIKQEGTAYKDNECSACSPGTFSNGSLHICQPHSKCEDLGLIEIKAGTLSTDAECGDKPPAGLIAGITVLVLIVVAVLAVLIFLKIKHKTVKQPGNRNHSDGSVNYTQVSAPRRKMNFGTVK